MAGSHEIQVLTEKEVEVLDVFIRHEPGWEALAQTISGESGKKYRDGKPPTPRVSATTAGKVCRDLTRRHILVRRPGKAKSNGAPTNFYSLPVDFDGFRRVAATYLYTIRVVPGYFATSRYGSHLLTAEFVRYELARRGVRMNRAVEFPESMWRDRDRHHVFGRRRIHLHLPLTGAPRYDAEFAEALVEAELYDGPWNQADREFVDSVIRRHRTAEEDQRLVIPILALCIVSPTACRTFLSDWKAFDLDRTQTPDFGAVEHLLFRMVFDAVNDLSIGRDTPQGADVTFATVCPENGGCIPEASTLLELDWKHEHRIGYGAGFDTDHMVVFGEDVEAGGVEVERNPENAWVKLAWTEIPKPPWLKQAPADTNFSGRLSNEARASKEPDPASAAESEIPPP